MSVCELCEVERDELVAAVVSDDLITARVCETCAASLEVDSDN
jgi:protein-arginine kinase activator protein McsA